MNSSINVVTLNTTDYETWNSFVDVSPQGDVFCYSWWLDAITKGNFRILAIWEKEKIVAGIPLAYYFGRINEPPLTRTLGPLFKDLSFLSEHKQTNYHRKWLNALIDEIPQNEFEQFCTSHNFHDWLAFRWKGYKQTSRYTYVIDYKNKDIKELWSNLSRGRKESINKAKKNNIRSQITDDLFAFYELIKLTYKRQNKQFNFKYEDFKTLDNAIKKHNKRVIITVFDSSNQAHASIYLVFNNRSAYALLSGGNPEYRALGGHTMVMWEAIKYFHNKVSYFNFGGSDIERIENHIRGFGGEQRIYFHIFKDKQIIKEVEKIKEVKVYKEIHVSPPIPDNAKYLIQTIFKHSWQLIKKALYKIYIKFPEPVKVSIVSACYNQGKYVHEMLDSLMNQTYKNFEIIIVNDGSTDDTEEILNRIKNKKLRVFHTDNFGPAHARNYAIKKAKGDIIFNIDADDKTAPDFLSRCVRVMNKFPNIGIVYSNVQYFDGSNELFKLADYSKKTMLKGNVIIANACFRKLDWDQVGGYSNSLPYGCEDYDLWLSIIELGRSVHQIKQTLNFYRKHKNTLICRSGKRMNNSVLIHEIRLQIAKRHLELIKQFPEIWKQYLIEEKHYKSLFQTKIYEPESPIFSIITPTNNRPDLLKRTIESVINQEFKNWEQIIVDDANQRGTKELVESFNDPRLKYLFHDESKGAAAAYNTGIKNSRGLYINFLDDDDEYLTGILEKIFNIFINAPTNPGFVWTGISRVRDTEKGEELIRNQVWPTQFKNRTEGFKVSTAIGNGFGLSVRKICIDSTSLYDETMTVGEDTDFLIKLSKKYNFRTVPEILVKIHHHGHVQLTDNSYLNTKIECYQKIFEKHIRFFSEYFDVFYIHNRVFTRLCFQANMKKTGILALLRIIKTFPKKRILWLDLICYLLIGKEYELSKLKLWVKKNKAGRIKSNEQNLPQSIKPKTTDNQNNIFDKFRANYDSISFNQLIEKSNNWLHEYPEQAHYHLPTIKYWFEKHVSKPANIIEIGGWRGDLAKEILSNHSSIEYWDNYDVISDKSTQKCNDSRYNIIPLQDYIWNKTLDKKYNALISTHMIEHIKWHELKSLIEWIPDSIETVLFEAPIVEDAENFDWSGDNSTHILEKGWKQVKQEMIRNGFNPVYEENITVIFLKDKKKT